MGDCGAFTYVREPRPPYSAAEVADFYENCGFDYGLSVDHVILAFASKFDDQLPGLDMVPREWRERQNITLQLAADFISLCRSKRFGFTPIGVAQGWSPKSYALAVKELQRMGYQYIAFGGMVPLKTGEILATLKQASEVREPETRFHLLGVTRCENLVAFSGYGVVSFDSTSPLRRAFKDDKDNYYTLGPNYAALRVPQVEANPKLVRTIQSGRIDQRTARILERRCLESLLNYDEGHADLEDVLHELSEYEKLFESPTNYTDQYRKTLDDKPWKKCSCEICRALGIHVVMFRGAERNRRRGFHNLYIFHQRLMQGTQPSL
jgi:queuine/archaeosine tRNA-ribosyltransferase